MLPIYAADFDSVSRPEIITPAEQIWSVIKVTARIRADRQVAIRANVRAAIMAGSANPPNGQLVLAHPVFPFIIPKQSNRYDGTNERRGFPDEIT